MRTDIIYNEDCNKTMTDHIDDKSVDIVLTSPPYNTSVRAGKSSKATLLTEKTVYYPSTRYDVYMDNMTTDEYIEWTVKLFNGFDRILKKDGCIIYNISYSSSNRDTLFLTIAAILARTDFSMMDMIVWKKSSALPNNTSPNKLTRIVEPVFVFARKDESDTFVCNKKVMSVRERTGQRMFENVFNFIEARNNDGANSLNKATYSTELCEKLLMIYGRSGMTVYDPFMGTVTTAVACKRHGMHYIGSELSEAQTAFAVNRIAKDDGEPTVYDVAAHANKSSKKAKRKTVAVNTVQERLFDETDPAQLMAVNRIPEPQCSTAVPDEGFDEEKEYGTNSEPLSALERELDDEFSADGSDSSSAVADSGYGYINGFNGKAIDDSEFE